MSRIFATARTRALRSEGGRCMFDLQSTLLEAISVRQISQGPRRLNAGNLTDPAGEGDRRSVPDAPGDGPDRPRVGEGRELRPPRRSPSRPISRTTTRRRLPPRPSRLRPSARAPLTCPPSSVGPTSLTMTMTRKSRPRRRTPTATVPVETATATTPATPSTRPGIRPRAPDPGPTARWIDREIGKCRLDLSCQVKLAAG